MNEKRLMITSDDFGISPSLNEAVLLGAEKGILTSTSLLCSMPFAREGLESARLRTPRLGIGLHLTLTSGPAVLSPERIPLLVDEKGRFRHSFASLFLGLNWGALEKRREFQNQVLEEWLAQFYLFKALQHEFGFRVDHLDSHQHIHLIPGLDEIFWKINRLGREEADFDWAARLPMEISGSTGRFLRRCGAWFPGGLAKCWILYVLGRRSLRKNGLKRADFPQYFGVLDSGRMDLKAGLEIFSAWDGKRQIELNLHPSTDCKLAPECIVSEADRKFHSSPWRRRELDFLLAPEAQRAILFKTSAETEDEPLDQKDSGFPPTHSSL